MSIKPKVAVAYLAAIVIPLLFGFAWHHLPALLQPIPTIVSLLFVALFSRFGGFGPAVTFVLASSGVVGLNVSRFVSAEPGPISVQVAIYCVASILIAGLCRERSEAEQRYRSLVELAPDGFIVMDETGKIVFANSALARIIGARDASELIGRQAIDFVHPDEQLKAKRRIEDLSTGKPITWAAGRAVRLDGTIVEVERAGIPLRIGDKLFAHGFVRDISERTRAAARIEESQRRLQALFDNAIDAIIIIDTDGHYLDANPAATTLTGYSHEEILHMKAGDLRPPDKRQEVFKLWQTVTSGSPLKGEFEIVRKDGQTRDVEFATVADMVPGIHAAFMHDVTALKDAERALRRLSGNLLRLQDEERRHIARELHDTTAQNLAALRMNLSRIGNSESVSDPAIKETLRESMSLVEQSIAEVRTLSYLLHPPLIDEVGLVPSLRWFARGLQERSGIEVTLDATGELDRLPTEVETALFRIVQEGLTNIQRHSGSPVALIRLDKDPHTIRLAVEDQGRGLPTELREPGALAASGVGIASIQERVRELGGEMQIESSDRGTRIAVSLPIADM